MSERGDHAKGNSLDEIIDLISGCKYPELIWVGKNYSQADLIRDLKEQASESKGGLNNKGSYHD